jgi:hypothetical protein
LIILSLLAAVVVVSSIIHLAAMLVLAAVVLAVFDAQFKQLAAVVHFLQLYLWSRELHIRCEWVAVVLAESDHHRQILRRELVAPSQQ